MSAAAEPAEPADRSIPRSEVIRMFRPSSPGAVTGLPFVPLLSRLVLPLLLLSGGCSTRTLEGPQLKDVPVDFGLDREAESRRIVFEKLPMLRRLGYFLRGDEGTASVLLSEFEGKVSEAELELLRAERAESWARSDVIFSELRDVEIDKQDAWIWFERANRSHRLVAVIPYADDERIWSVDFYSSVARFQDDELMLRHVLSFARDPRADERTPVLASFFLFFAAAGLVIWYFRRARQYRRVSKM